MAEHVFEFAAAFLGDNKVGKTSLITSKGINSNDQAGIPSDHKYQDLDNYGLVKVHKKNIVTKKGNHCVLNIWDVKGHAEYRSFVARYTLAAAVTCLIYDVSNPESLLNIPYWLHEVRKVNQRARIVLVGNKADLERKVSTEQGEQYAKENRIEYFETSQNSPQELFMKISEIVLSDCCNGSKVDPRDLLLKKVTLKV